MSKDRKAGAPVLPDDTRFGKIHKERQANRGVREIPVEAWDTDEEKCVLYAYPLTMADVIALEKYPTPAEQNVMQMIRQCMDSKGDPYFTLIDRTALLNEPADVIGDILIKLNGGASSFNQELKKITSDCELFARYWLAEHLGVSLPFVDSMPATEISGWMAYFVIKGESPYPVHQEWLEKTKHK